MKKLFVLILAAGKGSRMKSLNPGKTKVVFEILGKPIIKYVIDAARPINPEFFVTIIGAEGEVVKEIVSPFSQTAIQSTPLGTGHAVMMASDILKEKDGDTIILCGDTPLITSATLEKLLDYHKANKYDLTILSSLTDNPFGYGRVVEKNGEVIKIVEEKEASEAEKLIKKINAGMYVFDNKKLFSFLDQLSAKNLQNEYYLTDLVEIFIKNNLKVGTITIDNMRDTLGINDRIQLAEATALMKETINARHMTNGVTLEDPATTYIGDEVEIGADTFIGANVHILGKSVIGSGNTITSGSHLENVVIGNNNKILSSNIVDSRIGEENEIGPFARIRGNSYITSGCRIGNFVECKNAILHKGVKAAHLTYLGDCEIGEKTNIGCGVITVNYDGVNKHRTTIGKNVFVGSNSSLIAPITLEDNAFVAAGSTISKDVPKGALAIERSKAEIRENFSEQYFEKLGRKK